MKEIVNFVEWVILMSVLVPSAYIIILDITKKEK